MNKHLLCFCLLCIATSSIVGGCRWTHVEIYSDPPGAEIYIKQDNNNRQVFTTTPYNGSFYIGSEFSLAAYAIITVIAKKEGYLLDRIEVNRPTHLSEEISRINGINDTTRVLKPSEVGLEIFCCSGNHDKKTVIKFIFRKVKD